MIRPFRRIRAQSSAERQLGWAFISSPLWRWSQRCFPPPCRMRSSIRHRARCLMHRACRRRCRMTTPPTARSITERRYRMRWKRTGARAATRLCSTAISPHRPRAARWKNGCAVHTCFTATPAHWTSCLRRPRMYNGTRITSRTPTAPNTPTPHGSWVIQCWCACLQCRTHTRGSWIFIRTGTARTRQRMAVIPSGTRSAVRCCWSCTVKTLRKSRRWRGRCAARG